MKKRNNSYPTGSLNYTPCEICGMPADDRHHVYGGCRRQTAEKYGMVMNLCRRCHMRLHRNYDEWLTYKRQYQIKFEKEHGENSFIEVFGRNYL